VAHPDLVAFALGPETVEQCAIVTDLDEGAAELTRIAREHFAAQLVHQRLLAVADAQHRQAAVQDLRRNARAVLIQHRCGRSGQDHAGRVHAGEGFLRGIERRDFGIDAGFAHAACDQLRDLTAEIDDEHLLVLGRLGHEVESGASDWARVWP